jgi:dsDNA-specific endonuclease/ATPase MutS2
VSCARPRIGVDDGNTGVKVVEVITDADDSGDGTGGEFDPFPEPVRLEITDTIDLHAFAPRDVRRVVEAYLEEARRAGFRSVRIIHGRGRYVQRAAVREILARTPLVATFTDAPPEAGGLGATVAHLMEGGRERVVSRPGGGVEGSAD